MHIWYTHTYLRGTTRIPKVNFKLDIRKAELLYSKQLFGIAKWARILVPCNTKVQVGCIFEEIFLLVVSYKHIYRRIFIFAYLCTTGILNICWFLLCDMSTYLMFRSFFKLCTKLFITKVDCMNTENFNKFIKTHVIQLIWSVYNFKQYFLYWLGSIQIKLKIWFKFFSCENAFKLAMLLSSKRLLFLYTSKFYPSVLVKKFFF